MESQVRLRGARSGPKITASSESILNSTSGGYDSNEGDNIKVYVRIRPPAKFMTDVEMDQSVCLDVTSSNSLTILSKPEPKVFTYDHVANMETTQEEVFSIVGKGIIEAFVAGFNGTIFAYGQTGSGKTFTMLGPPDDESDNFSHELRGVIPRGFEYLFSLINREQEKAGGNIEFLARCSFLEIYNEQIYDLLDAASMGLHLREDIKKGVFVEGLRECDVSSAKDAYSVLQSGWQNRRVASTSMNRESSRSHAVFTVLLESKSRKGGTSNIKVSKLHLVDLAGSERQKDTHAVDVRLKEAGSINKSLSALGNVIMALVDIAHGKKRHIHYRDSKLTFILRDSLGGNANTHIIANVHPSSRCFGETLSTLQFARRAKMIKNKAVVNEDVVGNVIELQAEIRRLKEQLSQSRAGIQVDTKTIAESSLENNSAPVSISRGAAFAGVDDGVQWKEMMLSAICERDRSEEEKQALQEKVQKLEELCNRKEKFLQSTKMILKFRETTIKKLERIAKKEKGISDEEEDSRDKEIQLLREEIKLMQDKIDHHPDVTRFATENLELRAEIKRLKAIDPSNGEFTQDMAKAHRYTLQLERQLRELMTGQGRELEKSLSSSQQSLEASNIELDKIKLELVQVQAKLCSTQTEMEQYRQSLQQKREELVNKSESYRIKELELQSEVSALRKSNNDLERALESLQLKTAVERTAMNSLHMQTIKTITSPRRFGTPRTTSRNASRLWASPKLSTPKLNLEKASQNQELPSKPAENAEVLIGDEPMPAGLLRKDSLNGSSDEEEVEPFWAEFNNETRDDEIVYMEALQNELKSLQDLYSQSLKAFHVEQSKHIHLSQTTNKLEHQLTELNELLTKERSVWRSAETDLTNQLTSVRDKYKEVQSNSTILKSEVDDLRVMLSSADKQLDAMKKDRHEEMIDASRKCAAVESRLVKMEVEFLNLQAEMDATAESNNNLQCELETCKDELEFFRHKNMELEEIISMERAKNTEAEERLQGTLERLQYEMEMNLKLGQEDKQDELIRSVETINSLRSELHDMQKKWEEQEKTCCALNADLEQSRADCAAQKWLNITDKKSLENLVKQVQDLRAALGEKESNVACLASELEDTRQSYKELESRLNEKKLKIQKLNDALKIESDKAARERSEREAETLALKEEIGAANRQIEELSQTLEQQQSQLQSLQGDHLQIKVEMADRMNQITSLEEQLVSTHASHESVLKELQSGSRCVDESVFVSNQIELEAARENLDRFAKLSVDWEQSRLSDRDIISALQRKCSEFEILHSDRELLEDRIRVLELELDTEKDLKSEKTMALMRELELARAESDRHYTAFHSVNVLKEEEGQARLVAEQKLKELEMNLFNAQEDVDSLQEELDRVKAMEEKVFKEKEDLKTQMAIANEEKAKLVQKIATLESSCEKLIEENAKLAGHQNLRQKIQTLMDIKRENQELKQELDLVAKECSCSSYERISKELRMVRDKESGRDKEGKKKPLGSRNCQSGSSVIEKRQVASDSTLVGKENQSLDL